LSGAPFLSEKKFAVPYLIDLIVLVVIVVFAAKGYFKGFWNEALTFAGFMIALVVAAALYKPLGQFVASLLQFKSSTGVSVVMFILLFIAVSYAFALGGQTLTKVTQKLELSDVNRVLGAGFGGLKGAFICGVILAVLIEKHLLGGLTVHAQKSILTPYLVTGADKLLKMFGF
jgi:membrane protein required for colicin V production